MLPMIFPSPRSFKLPRYKRTLFHSTVGATGNFPAILVRQLLVQDERRHSAFEEYRKYGAIVSSALGNRVWKKNVFRHHAEGALMHLR
jgi:hypothetical protein